MPSPMPGTKNQLFAENSAIEALDTVRSLDAHREAPTARFPHYSGSVYLAK